MKTRAYMILMIFVVSVLILLVISLFLLVKRHTRVKDSRFLSSLKLFLGIEKEKNSITQYFNNADKILKYFLKNNANYKYELPWYISFGAAQSGKTAFFANVPLETPIQLNYTDTSYINHYFFNEGVVIDIKSELIFNDLRHDFCWERLLEQLKSLRPMKNIDGIIYFVSLKDLLSNDANTMLQNKKDIELLYQKLWQLQNKFEMRIPVYMVFTHLDQIQSFPEFIEVFKKNKNDIFGWSNPFSLEAKFSNEWLDEMKRTLDEEMKNLLSEVMVNFPADVSFNIMDFINNFQEIYPKVCEHLSLTFQSNKYTKGLYFRGAYFTAVDSTSTNYEKVPFLNNEEAEVSGGYQVEQSNIFFARDLLVNKVFAEKEIGKEDVDKKKIEHDLTVLRVAFSTALCASTCYGVKVYNDLSFISETLYPKILKIDEVLDEYQKDKNYVNRRDFLEELKVVLQFLGDLSSYRLSFLGVPSSLFSSAEKSKKKLVLLATKKLVLTTLFNEIEAKFIKVSKVNYFDNSDSDINSFVNPLNSREFKNLCNMVKIIVEIEQYEQKFISFKDHSSISSLGWLLENILNIKMPGSFERSIIFSSRMDLGELDVNRFYEYKKDIRKKFRLSLNKFIINCFSKDKINQYFLELERLLFLIDSVDKGMNYDNLKSVQKYISDLVTLFSQPEFDWLRSKNFSSPEFEQVLQSIESAEVLGGEDTVSEILNRTTTAFNGFKKSLGCYQLPLIGSPFYNVDEKIHLSESILDLQGILNDVFSESFMESFPRKNFVNLAPSQAIYWNVQEIKNIAEIIKEYKVFEDKFTSSSTKIDLIIKNVAKNNLKNLIKYNLIKGSSITTLDLNHSHLSDVAENVKNTSMDLQKILDFVFKSDVDLFRIIKDIQKESLLNLLSYIDRSFQMENLYEIKEDMFLLDTQKKKLYFNFNISDYLITQKKQMEFFSVVLASPVVLALEHINFLDNVMLDLLVVKWKDIEKNLEDYKSNPANSKLFFFEELVTKVQTASLRDLFQKDLKMVEANINKDSFFETKVFMISQRINNAVDASISKILVEQYEESLLFYKEYNYAFPFDIDGNLIGVAGYNKMQELIKKQEDIVTLVKIVKPAYDSPVFRFVENLAKLSQMVSFLMSSDKCFTLNFKQYQPIGDLYEKNLHLVVSCTAKVNGQKPLDLYKAGNLKIYDLVSFEVSIAKNCGKKICKVSKSGYKVQGSTLALNFDKQGLMRFLIENTVEINHSLFIRFTIDIEDDKGIKDAVVIMIPVDLLLDGVKYTMPDRAFTKISEG